MKWMRKPGEPIYLRRHMAVLLLAICLPIVVLQMYKIYVEPISFGKQLVFVLIISICIGLLLHLAYRRSARNER